MENWRGFLQEKKMLGPGEKGWDKFIKLVAEAYRNAPEFEDRAVYGYLRMMPYLARIDKQIKTTVDVEEVPYHPYRSSKGMRRQIKKTGKFMVSTADSDHPIFNNQFKHQILSDDDLFDKYLDAAANAPSGFGERISFSERVDLKNKLIEIDFAQANTFFRTVHDFQAHVQGEMGFSKQGEFSAYNLHAKQMPNACIPVLFTEVVGQISCFYDSGKKNCGQKAAILDGFDFFQLGSVEGYDIINKELVKNGSDV